MIDLDKEAKDLVEGYWYGVNLSGRVKWQMFRGIASFIAGRASTCSRLRTWKEFSRLSGLSIDALEPFVNRLRTSGGRHTRWVESPRLPFNLATISGARLLGYQGDVNSSNSALTSKDISLHEDFEALVREVVGEMKVTRSVVRGGLGRGLYLRTNAGKLVARIALVAGFNNTVDQKLANNPLPVWLFDCDRSVVAACLGSLWDTEGSVNFRDLKLSQAVLFELQDENAIPAWPSNRPFGGLRESEQRSVLQTPPLLLVSAALLLRSIGIVSRLMPTKVCMTSTGPTSYWQLRVSDDAGIRRFHMTVSLKVVRKQERLAAILRQSGTSRGPRGNLHNHLRKGGPQTITNAEVQNDIRGTEDRPQPGPDSQPGDNCPRRPRNLTPPC
jgi:hypothetical protein